MAKVALLIGVSEYEPGLNPLPSAVRDVEALYEVLLHPEMGGFAASDITLLKNPERQVVERAIETLFSGRHRDDLLLLYFSGHGIKDDRGRLYLATRNTSKTPQGELIRSTSVSANFIHDRMSESRSRRQVVILDSCFSGAFAEGMSAKDDGTIDIREQLGGEGRAVLTSSTSTQYSFEEEGQDLSIYTRFLVEGIKSGEADRDRDEFISIDELHEYASQKVRELQPAMKPKIYTTEQGFKIRLTKVAPGDPRQRYRKEVAQFIHRGEISLVGRRTLDYQRTRLGLETTEAKAIEDQVLEPYRNEFREKLQQYQQVFTELLERDETITDSDRHDLQNLQQILGLRNEDTMPIEALVTVRFKTHQQNLQTYQQAFTTALRQEFPLSAASRDRLRQTQQQLELADGDIAAIKSQITAEVEAYHQKLQDYQRLFLTATQQEYPLSKATQNDLRQQQHRLGLTDVDVAPIEAQITTQIESYHQKLQQYEQAFVKATQRQHYPDQVMRKQLQQTWQTLVLSEGDVGAIERRINAEIETHQGNLRQYEQEFTDAIQQEYPLSAFKRSQLTQRHQALNLTAENVTAIENLIVVAIEEHRQKLQQYEEVFRESMQFEYPFSDVTRQELRRFQQVLELTDEDVLQVQEKIFTQQPSLKEVSSQSLATEKKLHQEAQQHGKTKDLAVLKSSEITSPRVSVQPSILSPLPDSESTQKGLRTNLVWLGILPLLLLGSGIWYFLLDQKPIEPNTYIQWTKLVRNFSEVANVPSGQFTYTGEKDSTWSYVLTQAVDNSRLGDLLTRPKPDATATFNYESVLSANVNNPIKSIEEVQTSKKDFAITSLVDNITDKLSKKQVAYDGLIVFLPLDSRSLTLANALGGQISLEQLRQIYTGKITNWQQISPKLSNLPVKVFAPTEPEAISKFQEIVLKNNSQDKALFEATVLKTNTGEIQNEIRSETLEKKISGIISFGIISKTWKQCTGYPLAIADGKKSAIQPLFQRRDRRSINPLDDLCQHDDYYVDVTTFQSYPLGYPIFVVYPEDSSRLPGGSTFAQMLTTRQGQCLLSKVGLVALQPMPDDINSYACKSIP